MWFIISAVVGDAVKALYDFVEQRSSIPPGTLSDDALMKAWEMGESMQEWFRFLYQYHDGFTLLVSCAAGTRYANFQHNFAEKMAVKTYEYFLEAKNRGLTGADISTEEMHILLSVFWTTVYEPFIHNYTLEQIEAYCELMCRLFNWYCVLGFDTAE